MNCEELIPTITSLASLGTILFMAVQVNLTKKSNSFTALKSIYDENIKIRQNYSKGILQIDSLVLEISGSKKPNIIEILGKPEYKELREIGYHFELIGTLVKRNIIPFNVVFDIIVFPDDFWNKSKVLVEIIRKNGKLDFWLNFAFLREKYTLERK